MVDAATKMATIAIMRARARDVSAKLVFIDISCSLSEPWERRIEGACRKGAVGSVLVYGNGALWERRKPREISLTA